MEIASLPPVTERPLSDAERLAVLDRVDELLELTHRSATLGNVEDPLAEAVYIILSRQTREDAYQRAYADLRARWPTWPALLKAPIGEVTSVLRPAGFGPSRAAQLLGLLERVAAECRMRKVRGLTLDWLHDLEDEEVMAFLLTLPGIGKKSARCVMHYSLGRQVFAVDTHARRILHRLGIVPDSGGKVRHELYEAAIPPRKRQQLHVNLVHHGRAFCRSQSPQCGACPLISFCPTGRTASRAPDARTSERGTTRRSSSKATDQPVVIELFAGGGGLGRGFADAGFDIALAIERDRAAAQTYRLNHPGTVVLEADATQINGSHIRALVPRAAHPAAIIAGPPCQGYSAAGKRVADAESNSLYRTVVALAAELRPRFVVIENVPGMRHVEGRSFVCSIIDALSEIDFDADAHLLRACDFGVPQLRRRMIFLAQAREFGSAPPPPRATHCPGRYCTARCGDAAGQRCGRQPTPTVLEQLQGLPTLDPGCQAEYALQPDGAYLTNGSTMAHSDRVIEKIQLIEAGSGPISYRRLHQDMARTIVAGHRALPVHPYLHRTLSVREAARIQGFPDEHTFAGSRSQQPLQVANAVPPPLAGACARQLRQLMEPDADAEQLGLRAGRRHPAP